MEKFPEANTLDEMYEEYFGSKPRIGWLLNYRFSENERREVYATLYFVDEDEKEFKVRMPYASKFLVAEVEGEEWEDVLLRRYSKEIAGVERVKRYDSKIKNYLNSPPRDFLEFSAKNEEGCGRVVRELRDEEERGKKEGDRRVEVHEYDIPREVRFATENGIRVGRWYVVGYDGEKYSIKAIERETFPDLRTIAFDIETTKEKLKFPDPKKDKVVMISLMSEGWGGLIVNREEVSKDIQEFEYRAKEDMRQRFRIYNEGNEEGVIKRFYKIFMEYAPHIVTTYNGDSFDWPFIEIRSNVYGLSLKDTLGVYDGRERMNKEKNFMKGGIKVYEGVCVVHMDCYKWVKRDSYLPMNSHGLKAVARIKLGYSPDEIDPEEMMECAVHDPQRLASYSVSDALATYFLFQRFVRPHVVSICTLIPLPPVDVLSRGSGTLCEALLISEAMNSGLLVPPKQGAKGLEFYKGRAIESRTYVGGHVESLRAGIFRSDFDHSFEIPESIFTQIANNFDSIFCAYVDSPKYSQAKDHILKSIQSTIGRRSIKGLLYHLDISAMYPNIILTNRMQPHAIVSEDVCINCDFNLPNAQCQRRMEWVSRAEVYPPTPSEIRMLLARLNLSTPPSTPQQERLLRESIVAYSKRVYHRVRRPEISREETVVCQRALPFYIKTVRKFRDQRYVLKEAHRQASLEFATNPSTENHKRVVIYSGLQVAYKCVLNSFYGYVMRTGSRWFSLEMAAAVCHVGGKIIRGARRYLQQIGIPLELDTDGIWCVLPCDFPCIADFGDGRRADVLSALLNYFVCKNFSNDQYHSEEKSNENTKKCSEKSLLGDKKSVITGEISTANFIAFESDGPYRTMVIPSSTDEGRLLKKRYAVFDAKGEVVELKGFELKRRGELQLVKRFQEEIFSHFHDGESLEECYGSLGKVCNYWLDIIESKGSSLDDRTLFDLFSESRMLSKGIEEYGEGKSVILTAARRLGELLGIEKEGGLSCEFVVSRFPENAPAATRVIPVAVFQHPGKDQWLKKWLKCDFTAPRDVIDWTYYRKRFESVVLRMVVLPALFQGIVNPVPRIVVPTWAQTQEGRLAFNIDENDIEDLGVPRKETHKSEEKPVNKETTAPQKRRKNQRVLIEIRCRIESVKKVYDNRVIEEEELIRTVYVDVNDVSHEEFKAFQTIILLDKGSSREYIRMDISERDYISARYQEFFGHFAIRKAYTAPRLLYQLINDHKEESSCETLGVAYISSFVFHKHRVFCISRSDYTSERCVFVSDGTWYKKYIEDSSLVRFAKARSLKSFCDKHLKDPLLHILCPATDPLNDSVSILKTNTCPETSLGGMKSIMESHIKWHAMAASKWSIAVEISFKYSLPVVNVAQWVFEGFKGYIDMLDALLYSHFLTERILPSPSHSKPHIIPFQYIRSGYHSTYCIQIECVGSSVLSIADHNLFVSQSSFLSSNFQVLAKFVKSLVIDACTKLSGAEYLLKGVNYWIKSGLSSIIDSSIVEVVAALQRRFMQNLLEELKRVQCNIVGCSQEIIILDTGKHDLDSAKSYFQYLRRKINAVPGFELVKLKINQIFKRLAFIDFDNVFYLSYDDTLSSFPSDIPNSFFSAYFSNSDLSNTTIYDIISSLSLSSGRLILRLLSYKRDTHGLASNCYKLLRSSEFDTFQQPPSSILIPFSLFCPACFFENTLRNACLKCAYLFSQDYLEDAAVSYLESLWSAQRSHMRYCSSCGNCEQRRLKDFCKCGGRYSFQDRTSEIADLKRFMNSKSFSAFCERVEHYYTS